MANRVIELEPDALAKLESAKWAPDETLSAVVRRAQFPGKPHVARELLDEFKSRAGTSPLSEAALDALEKAQNDSTTGRSHWDEP